MTQRKVVDREGTGGGEELIGVEGEETAMKIYCIRQTIYFQ